MALPPIFRDIEPIAARIFKDSSEYKEEKSEIIPLSEMSKEDSTEWTIPIDQKVETTNFELTPLEDLSIRPFSPPPFSLLKGKVFIGIDGSQIQINREELILLLARGVAHISSYNKLVKSNFDTCNSRCFYVIRKNLLRASKSIETDTIDYESVINKRIPVISYTKKGKTTNPSDQAFGYSVKMRQLCELVVADKASTSVLSKVKDPSKILVILDGNLISASITTKDYRKFMESMREKKIKVVGFVKRVSYSQLLVSLFKNKTEILEKLTGMSYKTIEEISASDAFIARRLLSPGKYLSFFQYKTLGKTRGEKEGDMSYVPDEFLPIATYVMTEQEEIYRIEMPRFYFDNAKTHESILEEILCLIRENNGSIPKPIVFADKLSGYNPKEQKAANVFLDYLGDKILKGVKLHKIYGN